MNKFEELKFNVEALFHAINEDKKFFSSIYNFVEKLHLLVTTNTSEAKKEEIKFLAQKIESFFANYRPSGERLYIPPMQTSRNDSTVKDIFRLSKEVGGLTDDEFVALKPRNEQNKETTNATMKQHCVFIGHGRNKLWASVQIFLQNELHLKTVSYESESRVGESIVPVLEKMLNQASYAILVLTCQMPGHRLPVSNGPICQDIGYPRLIRDSSGSKSSGMRYSNVSTMSFAR